ncbi:hypothetical protein DPX16_5895 [Anabarilius grahami]|uniref:Uncharacterized protein n=1 Tax=Anabarilius grahami TaxID=495550 RepID=A0A3N0Y2Z8_ANAGA|nr:hypothetical protein DPX16_5895 [Anabarilius grahami]
MAELDRFPGHRTEDGGARRRGGILRSTLWQGLEDSTNFVSLAPGLKGNKSVRDRESESKRKGVFKRDFNTPHFESGSLMNANISQYESYFRLGCVDSS